MHTHTHDLLRQPKVDRICWSRHAIWRMRISSWIKEMPQNFLGKEINYSSRNTSTIVRNHDPIFVVLNRVLIKVMELQIETRLTKDVVCKVAKTEKTMTRCSLSLKHKRQQVVGVERNSRPCQQKHQATNPSERCECIWKAQQSRCRYWCRQMVSRMNPTPCKITSHGNLASIWTHDPPNMMHYHMP